MEKYSVFVVRDKRMEQNLKNRDTYNYVILQLRDVA